jgi:hypothetical protein
MPLVTRVTTMVAGQIPIKVTLAWKSENPLSSNVTILELFLILKLEDKIWKFYTLQT